MSDPTPHDITQSNKDDMVFCRHCADRHKLQYFAKFVGSGGIEATAECRKARILINSIQRRPMLSSICNMEYYREAEQYVEQCMAKARRDILVWAQKLYSAFGTNMPEPKREEWLVYLNDGLCTKFSLYSPTTASSAPTSTALGAGPTTLVSNNVSSTEGAPQAVMRHLGPPHMPQFSPDGDKFSGTTVDLVEVAVASDVDNEGWLNIDDITADDDESLHLTRSALEYAIEGYHNTPSPSAATDNHPGDLVPPQPLSNLAIEGIGKSSVNSDLKDLEIGCTVTNSPKDGLGASDTAGEVLSAVDDHFSGETSSDYSDDTQDSDHESASANGRSGHDQFVSRSSRSTEHKNESHASPVRNARSRASTYKCSDELLRGTTSYSNGTVVSQVPSIPKAPAHTSSDTFPGTEVGLDSGNRPEDMETSLNNRIDVFWPEIDTMSAEVASAHLAMLEAQRDMEEKTKALEASQKVLARISATHALKKRTLDEFEEQRQALEQETLFDSTTKCASLDLWWQHNCATSGALALEIRRQLENVYIQGKIGYKREETERMHKLRRTS